MREFRPFLEAKGETEPVPDMRSPLGDGPAWGGDGETREIPPGGSLFLPHLPDAIEEFRFYLVRARYREH